MTDCVWQQHHEEMSSAAYDNINYLDDLHHKQFRGMKSSSTA